MDFLSSFFTPEIVHNGIRLTTPILFGAIASALSSRAGVLNLAIEAKMLVGAFVGLFALNVTQSAPVAIVVAAIAGAVTGLIMAGAHRIGVDLVVFAIGLNMLVAALSIYLMRVLFGGTGVWRPEVETLPSIIIPGLDQIPVVGSFVSGYNALVYFAFFCAILFGIFFRLRSGRHTLAVGQAPQAAASAGLSVSQVLTWGLVGGAALPPPGGPVLPAGPRGLCAPCTCCAAGRGGVTCAPPRGPTPTPPELPRRRQRGGAGTARRRSAV